LVALLADGIFRPTSGTLYPTITHGSRTRPRVALTFDDGPDAAVTPAILDTLGRFGARGTFFVIGRNLERNLPIAQRVIAERHELGNHSWTHSHFQNFYSAASHARDIARNSALIRQLTGATTEPLYRPPVGLKSPALARAAHAQQLRIVAWSVHTRDTFSRDAASTAARAMRRIQAGDIVLLHDGHNREGHHRRTAAESLPLILTGLRERGLECVTVSELLSG
jgi:peptidoglycan-N-acetylglucosamine deacetylase